MISFNIWGRGRALRIAVGITALVLLLADGVSAETPISACTEISSPGAYVLTQNIVNTTNLNCIIIAQPTFEVFLAPIQPIAYDPANDRITLQLVDGSEKIFGAQSVAVSTT